MRARLTHPIVVILLMGVHAALLWVGIRRNFVVLDEIGHVPAGLSHWQTGEFSLYRVNPPLARMLAALPVLAANPDIDYRGMSNSPVDRADWAVGGDFIRRNGPRYLDLIRLARLPGVAWSLAGLWLIARWAQELYGPKAGCLAAALWCFDPTVIAFAQVVTPDVPASVAGLAATYAFWRYTRRPTWGGAILAGAFLGVAQLTKFTLLILYAAWPLIRLLGRPRHSTGAGRRESGGGATFRLEALQASAIALTSLAVINLGYGYRETFRPLEDFEFVSRPLAGDLPTNRSTGVATGNRFRGTWWGRLMVPLPAEFVQGIDAQRKEFERGYRSYLRGRWRTTGWWYYYLYALAVKEPIGTIAIVLWGLALVLIGHRASSDRSDEPALWVPAGAILLLVSSQTGFNHHMRYLLPMFPFVAVASGKLAWYIEAGRMRLGWVVSSLLLWTVASSLAVFPHSMSYFNEAAGGPGRGPEHLLDSNIDWGQDLLHLGRWLEEHPEAHPLGLAYYNAIDPRIIGIRFHLPPPGPGGFSRGDRPSPEHLGPAPGYHAISVNFLWGASLTAADGRGGGRWIGPSDAYAYFRRFRPIARAGYSIYIYRITPDEAERERRRLGLPPLKDPSPRPPR